MKILFVGHSLLARRQYSFIEEFTRKNEVTVIAPRKWGSFWEGKIPKETKEKIDFVFLPIIPYYNMHTYTFRQQYKIDKQLKDIDVLYVVGDLWFKVHQQTTLKAKQIGNPIVVTNTYENKNKMRKYQINEVFGKDIEKYFDQIRKIDIVLAGNKDSANLTHREYLDAGVENPFIYRIPHCGYDNSVFRIIENGEYDRDTFVFSGRKKDHLKNYDLAVTTAHSLGKKIHSWRFKEKEEQLPLEYSKGSVLLHTSIDNDYWSEQFGFVILEALATGLYVVASSVGSAKEWFKEVVFFADPYNKKQYINTVEELLRRINEDNIPNYYGSDWAKNNMSNGVIARTQLGLIKKAIKKQEVIT